VQRKGRRKRCVLCALVVSFVTIPFSHRSEVTENTRDHNGHEDKTQKTGKVYLIQGHLTISNNATIKISCSLAVVPSML